MSRWTQDPDGAADALILRSLDDIGVAGAALLVNQSRSLPSAVQQRGAACTVWNRRLVEGVAATPWPPQGPFDLALARLPKAHEEQAMTVHAALSVLKSDARLILYGGNDEGIRSAAALLEEAATDLTIIAARGHGRVLAARRGEEIGALRGSLEAWRSVSSVEIGGSPRAWVSYPGCFAAGRLDEGTALLLSVPPPLPAGARVLDYGCGPGTISAAVLMGEPGLRLDAMDSDAVALEAARENVPAANLILGTRLAAAGRGDYAAILSNPPLHQGIAEDRASLERLVSDAPLHLAPGGCLQFVVQRRVAAERLLARQFTHVEMLAQGTGHRVWRAWGRAP